MVLAGCSQPAAPPNVALTAVDPAIATLIETSRTAVVASPRSGLAWGRLGQAFHAAEFHGAAVTCYSNALIFDQRDPRWPYLCGLLQLQEAPDAALSNLARAAVLAGPDSDSPQFALARALAERARFEDARRQLNALVTANPAHAAAHLELARLEMRQNNFREATRELQMPLTNSVTIRQALVLASQIAQRNNQPEVAAQLSRRALAMPRGFDWPDKYLKEVHQMRTDREKLADQVNVWLQQKRLPEASAALERLLSAVPNDPEGLLLLGRLRYLEKNCPAAEAAFRRHLEVRPGSLNGLVQLGLSLLCQEQWTNAAAAFQRTIDLKPDFAAAHSNLGTARSHAGDSPGAIQAYREALRCSPGDVNAMFALAEELANAGQLTEAIEYVKRAEAVTPRDPRIQRAREQLHLH